MSTTGLKQAGIIVLQTKGKLSKADNEGSAAKAQEQDPEEENAVDSKQVLKSEI